jgi:phospholipid/cholesterol/gamma-HCH transport system substrate-binding protein
MTRVAAAIGALLATATLVVVLVHGDDRHTLHLRFADAGQLVTGGRVSIATQPVGRVTDLSLSPDGQADVQVAIEGKAWPLHLGTTADIRLTSQVGIANRYIALTPGDVRAPALKDGAVLGTDYTRGVVDIDESLNDFTPRVRNDLRAVLRGFETSIDGVVPQAQAAIQFSAPALAQSDETLAQLTADAPALRRLLAAGSQVSGALARNANALSDTIDSTATLFAAVADERTALSSVLTRAPRVLPAATRTLRRLRASIDRSVRPTLRQLMPAARPLADVLDRLPVTAQLGVPWIQQLRSLLPATTLGLRRMTPLATSAVPALAAAAKSIEVSQGQFAGLRQYAPDVLIGGGTVFGAATGYYDATGHYVRFNLVTAEDAPVGGIDAALGGPTRMGYSTGHDSPCPGGATQPAPDKSNPRTDDKSICNPKDDLGG